MIGIPSSLNDIDAAWLTSALKEKGLLKSKVLNVDIESIGAGIGLMSELGRLTIKYADAEILPSNIVAKCAAQNENRDIARILDYYHREANFYDNLSKDCPLTVPKSYFTAVDSETYDCVFLMEDLGDHALGDQLEGCTREQAEHSIERVADMHGKWWNKLEEYPWAYDSVCDDELIKLGDWIYKPGLEPTIENFSDCISSDMQRVMRAVGAHYQQVFQKLSGSHRTFIHGDYRLDNIVYRSVNGKIDSTVLDWQLSGLAPSMWDIAYFMCQSLKADLCREIERDLIRLYHDRLLAAGVENYSHEECWNDYRIWILFCLIYPVAVCGTLDLANDRGNQLATVMLERNVSAVDALGCEEFLADYL